MEEQNSLPPIPPTEPIPEFLAGDEWFEVDISQDMLDFTKPYTPPRFTLERKGVQFADVGELHIVSGKYGNGKTHLMIQFMAALLGGHCGMTYYCLSEQRPHPVILYVDTEQGEDNTIGVKNKVCLMAGLPYDQKLEQFNILRLRDTELAKDRWRKILKAIWIYKPTNIFLDGLLDIVEDYNDQKECQPIIRKCMKIATYYDASLWMVMHENPLNDKLVGTIGSIAQRKVSEIFNVRKHKQDKERPCDRKDNRPDIYFSVEQIKARNRDVLDWDFEVVIENGWALPRECIDSDPMPEFKTSHTVDELKQWIIDRQADVTWPAKHSEFFAKILEPNGVTDKNEQKELLQMALNRRFISKQVREEMKPGQTSPRLKLNEQEIPPFTIPMTESDIPF